MASLSADTGSRRLFCNPDLKWWSGRGLIYGRSTPVTASSRSERYQSPFVCRTRQLVMETDGKDRRARWFLNHYQVNPQDASISYHTDMQLSAAPLHPPTPARPCEFWGRHGFKKIKLNGSFPLSIHIPTWFYAGLKASQLHTLPPPVPPSRLPPGQYQAGQLWFVCPVLHHAGLLVNRLVFSLQPRLMWRAAKQCRWIMGGLWSAWAANKARIIHLLRIRLKHIPALNSWSLGKQFTFVVP